MGYQTPIRDDTFGFTVEIDPRVSETHHRDTIRPPPTATKSVFRTFPKVPKSFPVGIEIAMGDQASRIQVPNIATGVRIEDTISHRWGVRVQFKGDGKPTVWVSNHGYEVEPVVPGQKPKMTEQMIAQAEADKIPQTIDVMLAVGQPSGTRYPAHVQILADATWDDLIQASHQQLPMNSSIRSNRQPLSNVTDSSALQP
jgi:hypothetical protein